MSVQLRIQLRIFYNIPESVCQFEKWKSMGQLIDITRELQNNVLAEEEKNDRDSAPSGDAFCAFLLAVYSASYLQCTSHPVLSRDS